MLERHVNLVDERIDLAIRITNTLEPGIIARPLARCPSLVCASPHYLNLHGRPQTPEELTSHSCLTHAKFGTHSWVFNYLNDSQKEIRIPIKSRICANEAMVLKQAALAGVGITVLPVYFAKTEIAEGKLEAILTDYTLEEMSIYAIYTSRNHMSAALRALLDYLDSRFKTDEFWKL